jgi:hypothetical protein
MKRLLNRWYLIPAAVVAVLACLALVGALAAHKNGSSSGTSTSNGSVSAGSARVPAPTIGEKSGPAFSQASAGAAISAPASAGDMAAQNTALTVNQLNAAAGRYLVRDGYLTMVVKRGMLSATVAQMTQVTTSLGGYVVSSFVGTADTSGVLPAGGALKGAPTAEPALGVQSSDGTAMPAGTGSNGMFIVQPGDPYATLTVAVPARNYDAAVRRLSAYGDVKQLSTSTSDVTGQYVDLKARLQHYQAVERELVSFLSKAKTVGETLSIQDRINATQLTIEQLSAEFKALSETVNYSTLSLTMTEHQPVAAAVTSSGTFGGALGHSLRLIADGAQVLFVAGGAALPFAVMIAIIGALVWIAARRYGQRRRQLPPAVPPMVQ